MTHTLDFQTSILNSKSYPKIKSQQFLELIAHVYHETRRWEHQWHMRSKNESFDLFLSKISYYMTFHQMVSYYDITYSLYITKEVI